MSDTFQDDNYVFTVINDKQVVFGNHNNHVNCGNPIIDYSKISLDFVIPSHAKNNGKEYEVTIVESNAFCYSNIKSLVIPQTIETLSVRALCNMYLLEEITFEESSRLKTILHETFMRCSKLKKVVLPPSVQSISTGTFAKFGELEEIHYCGRSIIKTQNLAYPIEGVNASQVKAFVVSGIYRSRYFGNMKVIFTSECISNPSIKGMKMTCRFVRSVSNKFMFM